MKHIKQSVIILFLMFSLVKAQTSVNPDISLIGSWGAFTNFNKGTAEYGKLNFETPGMELYIDGYLNPISKASANIAYEDGSFAVEELYAEIFNGLPFDLQLKAGKFLSSLGKLNTQHPHAWPFLSRPLFHQIYFGEEGFNDIGLELNALLPTGDIYTNWNFGLLKGDAIAATIAEDGENSDDFSSLRGNNPVITSRLSSFLPIDDFHNLELGLSTAFGIYEKTLFDLTGDSTENKTDKSQGFLYGIFDFKYKYRPNQYTALTIGGEALLNSRQVMRKGPLGVNTETEKQQKISTYGACLYFNYQFLKQFNIGFKYDYTNGIIGDAPSRLTLSNDDKNSTQGFSGWIAYFPVEETMILKLGVEHLKFKLDSGLKRDSETTIKMQMFFSLGPHKAHIF